MPAANERPDRAIPRLLTLASRSSRRRRVASAILRVLAPTIPNRPPPDRPVFVLGSPRSGTTMLFDLLEASPALASLGTESHLFWELYHRPGGPSWRSHEVRPEDIRRFEPRLLRWAVSQVAGERRYLDKSPRNSVRGRYLEALFPEARFVHLRRDGRAVVSSLITGWREGGPRFPGLAVPTPLSIEGYDGASWKYVAPPGWREMATGHTLPEVCAFQWVAANRAILEARAATAHSGHWVDLRYEDLVADPVSAVRGLLEALELPVDEAVLEAAAQIPTRFSKVAVGAPRPDRWRDEHPEEVGAVLAQLAEMQDRLGYPAGLGGHGEGRG